MILPYLGIAVASVVAAVVSVMEISIRRDKGLYLNATLPCIFYVAYDASAAIIVYIAFRAGAELLKENPTIAAAVVSGLVGPLLMRTKVPLPFRRDETGDKQLVNAVAMLRRLQLSMSAVIDDRCAAGETAWILDRVLPAIKTLPLADVEEWVIESIKVRYGGLQGRSRRSRYIGEVRKVSRDSINIDERKHLMIQILIDTCGRRQVVALVKRAEKQTRAVAALTSHASKRRILGGSGRRAIEGRTNALDSSAGHTGDNELKKVFPTSEESEEGPPSDPDLQSTPSHYLCETLTAGRLCAAILPPRARS